MWQGALWGAAVAALAGGLGLAALAWARDKDAQTLMVAFVGGMVVRLLLVAALSIAVLSLTSADRTSYVVALLLVYFLFLALEIYCALASKGSSTEGK